MNPVQMLKDDHQRVRQLFQQFRQTNDQDRQQQIADQVLTELDVHAAIEEEIFYPAMRQQAGGGEERRMLEEAYEEHAQAKTLIQQLRGMQTSDPQFSTLMQELQQDVEHHVQEEETEMLPKAEQELSDQMDRLGQEMQARKQQLMGAMGQTTR